MNISRENRGGAVVANLGDLDGTAAASVIYLRMWCSGPETHDAIRNDLVGSLGTKRGQKTLQSFDEICRIFARHGRHPLVHHSLKCNCIGSDEACFANFISTAAHGDRDDTMLIATLLVRVDMAPLVASLAVDFGLALKQMNLASPKQVAATKSTQITLH